MFYTWIALCVFFIIIEICTVNIVTIWFAFGAFLACLTSLIISNEIIQIIVFIVVSVGALLLTKPLVKKYLEPKIIKTNYDKVIGMTGIVAKKIEKLEYGEVKVDGKYWTAKANDTIELGSKVEILSIEGVKLVVKKKEEDD